ncbi:uncharacterized protein N7496_010963 [Penicillium cataractarum]|uniref:Uncharacterized protein n=1 Tax=Penicillium cataractarum TaxID=2100454 RepID=A0A9W9RE30_9EURO|nr:uncharacterized protein N7496_010963 [Penicillium cataractarum]KAJ5358550.1 hypothetical protein N7496_010963 [Penicillium cataractarum]
MGVGKEGRLPPGETVGKSGEKRRLNIKRLESIGRYDHRCLGTDPMLEPLRAIGRSGARNITEDIRGSRLAGTAMDAWVCASRGTHAHDAQRDWKIWRLESNEI